MPLLALTTLVPNVKMLFTVTSLVSVRTLWLIKKDALIPCQSRRDCRNHLWLRFILVLIWAWRWRCFTNMKRDSLLRSEGFSYSI